MSFSYLKFLDVVFHSMCVRITVTDNQWHYANNDTLELTHHTSLFTFSLLFSSISSLLPLTFDLHVCLSFALIWSLHPNPFIVLIVHAGVSAHMSAAGVAVPQE